MSLLRPLTCISALVFVTLSAAGFAECSNTHDYYSEIIQKCNKPNETSYTINTECYSALNEMIPFDDESFKNAPLGFKDDVISTFHVYLAWPLKLPADFTILGSTPGAITTWHDEIYTEWPQTNQSVFNHLMNIFNLIEYKEMNSTPPTSSAEYNVHLDDEGVLTLYKSFNSSGLFGRAALLMHEARHDGYFHVPCPGDSEFECDKDLNGPEGAAVVFREALLQGSGSIIGEKPAILTDSEAVNLARDICERLKAGSVNRQIYLVPAELEALFADIKCTDIDISWVIEHDKLNR